MVTARREDIDKIRGLGLGADDYIEKPFSPSVLVARVKANLSQFERAAGHKKPLNEIRIGNISVNTSTRRVFSGDREVFLNNREYELLLFMMTNADIVFDRESLYEKVWGLEAMGDSHSCRPYKPSSRKARRPIPRTPAYRDCLGSRLPVSGDADTAHL